MQLTKISGQNFMGGNFAVELGQLNYVHGRNDAGKTRLGNLIKLLLLGRLPSLDNKPRAIFDGLGSGKRLEIECAFDNGVGIYRSWEEKGASVKTAKHVPDEFDEKTPLVLLDPADYFGRSARGRVEMVFSVAKINADDKFEEIISGLSKILGDNKLGGRGSYTVQDWLDAALESVEESRSSAAGEVRRWTSTLQGLTHLQLGDKPATRSVDEIDEEIERERNEKATKTARRSTLKDAMDAAEQVELERDDLQHRIKEAGDPPLKDFDIDALRRSEKELAGKAKTIQDAIDAREKWSSEQDRIKQQIESADKMIARLEREISEAARINEELAVLEPPPKSKTCSKCGQTITQGVAGHPESPALRKRLAEIKDSTPGTLESARQDRREAVKRLSPEPPKPEGDLIAVQAELDKVRAEIDEYVATADVQAWRKQLAELKQPVDHSAEIATLDAAIAVHEKRVPELQAERKLAESDRADRKRLAEAQTEQKKALAAETRYKDAKKFLLDKKSELIEQVFGPLLKTAARFMDGIFPQPIEYRDGELGMFNGSSWVTEATFGGAKRAMLYAALKAALGARSPCRIIEMDELATIDSPNLFAFLMNVKAAHDDGLFDQFIGMTSRPELDRVPKGFTIIEATGNGYVTN